MKTQSYNVFWQRLHKTARENGFPLRAMFELTYRCNFKCRHCYVPLSYRRKRELKTREVFSILEQLADCGCFYLGFTGGEPFIREDIFEILGYAKKKGFEVIIYTNGSLVDQEKAEELAKLRPNKVDITIPAMAQAAFERITQSAGSHKKVFRAIELLRQKGVSLGFKTCVLKENQSEIADIERFARSLNVFHRLDDTLSRRLDGSEEPYKYKGQEKVSKCQSVRVSRSQSRKICVDKVTDGDLGKVTQYPIPNTQYLFKCGVGLSQVAVTPLGELKPCLMIDEPRYKIISQGNGGLKDGWRRLREFVASIQPDENYRCDRCKLKPYCKWCPAKSWLYKKDFTSCEPKSRRFLIEKITYKRKEMAIKCAENKNSSQRLPW